MRSFATATDSARGRSGSIVWTTPPVNRKSATSAVIGVSRVQERTCPALARAESCGCAAGPQDEVASARQDSAELLTRHGGKLASHLTGEDQEVTISLGRRLLERRCRVAGDEVKPGTSRLRDCLGLVRHAPRRFAQLQKVEAPPAAGRLRPYVSRVDLQLGEVGVKVQPGRRNDAQLGKRAQLETRAQVRQEVGQRGGRSRAIGVKDDHRSVGGSVYGAFTDRSRRGFSGPVATIHRVAIDGGIPATRQKLEDP